MKKPETAAMPDKTPVKDAINNPTRHFNSPKEVIEDPTLSERDKKKVLDSWEEDARRLSVATEEGMGGGEPSHMAEVAEAKAGLGMPDARRKAATKAG
jgi:hypothetical protein